MTTYVVTRKDTGAFVYRYTAPDPIYWSGMEQATHDHDPEVEEEPPLQSIAKKRVTKLEFTYLLGEEAYVGILALAKQSPEVDAWIKRLDYATPEADGTSIDLADPRTGAGLNALEPALVSLGIVGPGWAEGVLNG